MAAKPCVLHPNAQKCETVPLGKQSRARVHLSIFGTPCPPFSDQRCNKRKLGGAPAEHNMYAVTTEEAPAFLQKFAPEVAICEQVMGFAKPETPEDDSNPMERLLG